MPFTPDGIDERAWQALVAQAPHAERVDLSGSPVAYWELLRELWTGGEDVMLVEHDNVIKAGCVAALDACPAPWCSCPAPVDAADAARYRAYGASLDDAGLQVNRWRADLLAEAAHRVTVIEPWRRHWLSMNSAIWVALHMAGAHPHGHHGLQRHAQNAQRAPFLERADAHLEWARAQGHITSDEHARLLARRHEHGEAA
jgi:hypothetical protein